MKISIEASSFYGQRSGVGRYGLLLIQKLIEQDKQNEFVLFSFLRPGRTVHADFKLPKNASFRFIKWFPGRLFSLLMRSGIALPLEIFGIGKYDIAIFPNFITWASLSRKKRISVVHDLAFLQYPEFISKKNLQYLNKQLPKSIKRSTKVVAVSETTKRDLIQHYGVPSENVVVIYGAIDTSIFNAKAVRNLPAVKRSFNLPEKYLLFVGNIEPRKNIVGLLNSYADSFKKHRLPLVVIGAKGWNDGQIENAFEKYKELPIIRLGYVADNDMATIYAGAQIFLFPSFYEGFGIPPLEAMACGCPVICSNNSSLPEVVGSAAIKINPNDNLKFSNAITQVASDEKRRHELITAGYSQAKKFSWDISARQLYELIDSIA